MVTIGRLLILQGCDKLKMLLKEGIERSFIEAKKADIIIVVIDASRTMSDQELVVYRNLLTTYTSKCIIVYNKSDLPVCTPALAVEESVPCITLSATANKNIEQLERALEEKISHLFKDIEAPFLLNKRHYTLLLAFEQKLTTVATMLNGSIEYELLSYHIKDALEHLTELTGRSISEAGMRNI